MVQAYLINYLLTDEQKHNELLSRLDDIKKGIYRSVRRKARRETLLRHLLPYARIIAID